MQALSLPQPRLQEIIEDLLRDGVISEQQKEDILNRVKVQKDPDEKNLKCKEQNTAYRWDSPYKYEGSTGILRYCEGTRNDYSNPRAHHVWQTQLFFG